MMPIGPMLRFGFPNRVTSLISQISTVDGNEERMSGQAAMDGPARTAFPPSPGKLPTHPLEGRIRSRSVGLIGRINRAGCNSSEGQAVDGGCR